MDLKWEVFIGWFTDSYNHSYNKVFIEPYYVPCCLSGVVLKCGLDKQASLSHRVYSLVGKIEIVQIIVSMRSFRKVLQNTQVGPLHQGV